ncbi:hypothetical protein Nepgr_001798 [Nepenthes gracilis]|uniref:Uncharacterized protein n=1 Tax=Nepenthes gracilis TaxID=150966 RepID=A0AAD3RXB3_NEPGR|nr:hypothetical protein Nepgr_001798 [Nepenthes gracilis]
MWISAVDLPKLTVGSFANCLRGGPQRSELHFFLFKAHCALETETPYDLPCLSSEAHVFRTQIAICAPKTSFLKRSLLPFAQLTALYFCNFWEKSFKECEWVDGSFR